MADLLPFLILISAGLFLSELLRKFHLPYVVALIGAGMIIGPFGLGMLEPSATMDFIGSIGLIFLMFMAGLEIKVPALEKLKGKIVNISVFNGLIPFIVGFLIATFLGYGSLAALLVGTIFVSSSIAVVIPCLEAKGLTQTYVGESIIGATVIEDVLSLVMLSVILQTVQPTTWIPLPIYYVFVLASIIVLRLLIPTFRLFFFSRRRTEKDLFEQDIRVVFFTLVAVVTIFDFLGMHAIIGAFFAGIVLSDSMKSESLKKKLHAISYGLFIPAFFVLVGTETDLGALATAGDSLLLVSAIVLGSIISKFASGWVGGRIAGFSHAESALIGASSIPQLSTTLAVAFVGMELNILDHALVAAMVVLSAATTFVSPILISIISKKVALERGYKPFGLIE